MVADWPRSNAERRVGDLPAVVDAADDVVLRAAGVVEEHLAELGRAVGLGDAADLDAGLAHRHEQVRDALVLRRVGIGAGEQEAVVGVVAAGRPDLLPVDDPLVAVEHGRRLQAGQVGARVGLAEALAPAHLAAEDLGQELAASAPRCPTAAASGRRACRRRSRRASAPWPGRTPRRATTPSIVDRPLPPYSLGHVAQIQPPPYSFVGHSSLNAARSSALISKPSSNHPAGQVLLQPGADLLAELLGLGGVAQIHAHILTRRSSRATTSQDSAARISCTCIRVGDERPPRRPARPAVRPRRRRPPRDGLLRGRAGPGRPRPAGRLRHVGAPRLEPARRRSTRPTSSPRRRRSASTGPPRASTGRCSSGATPTPCPSRRGSARSRCSPPTTSPCSSTRPTATPRRRPCRTPSCAPTAAGPPDPGSPTASS